MLSFMLLTIVSFIIGHVYGSMTPLSKFLLPSGQGHCLDGTRAGYYYSPPPSSDTSLWVFFMKGGGACNTEQTCKKRTKSVLGSSAKWPNINPEGEGKPAVLSDDPKDNPDFYDAHHVYIPYCNGDTHTGQQTNATAKTWNLYFSGHINFMRIIDSLLANETTGPSLKKAKNVLLTGNSAGGIGAFFNVDYLAQRLSWATVKGAPNAGWFFPGDAEDHIGHSSSSSYIPSDWSHWSQGQAWYMNGTDTMLLWKTLLNADCVKSFPENENFLCGSVHNLYPFIKSPLFVMENQYDKNQITAQLGLPANQVNTTKGREYLAYFGRAMRNSTEQRLSLKPKDALFLPSCFAHAGLGVNSKTIIRGLTINDLLGDWFFQRGKFESYQIVDDCVMKNPGLPCNPTCPHF